MAVFITGGNGHIGSWIACLFARANKDIMIYDVNRRCPEYLEDYRDKIQFIDGDVLDLARLTDVIRRNQRDIEGIIHTVAIMGEFVPLNPYYNVRLNVIGLLNVLEVARIFGIKKVLFTSTGAVYGKKKGKATEEDCLDPQDLYASSKASAEFIGRQYAEAYNLDFRIGRLYFVYGPGRMPSAFFTLYKIAFGVLEGIEGLQSSKGGDQKIDFTYVLDAAQGIFRLFDKRNPDSRIYNFSSGESRTIEDVVGLCKKYTHFPVNISLGRGILMNRVESLDISRAQIELGYQPEYNMEEGIRLYSDWIKSQNIKV